MKSRGKCASDGAQAGLYTALDCSRGSARCPPEASMSLRIYNTLARALEDFSPIEPGHVRMYLCGITVYDLCHVGHARCNIAWDVVQRWLKASGFRVTFVRNITDIDDKIIRRAVENGESVRGL